MQANPSRQNGQVQLRYRKLVESLPGCIVFALDRDLRVTYAGGGLAIHAGFRPQTYLGCRVAEFTCPDVYAYAEPYLLATLAGEETSFEFDYPSGLSFDVRTTPLQGKKGLATEMLVVVLDTTERKRAADALRASEAALQQSQAAAHVGHWLWNLADDSTGSSRGASAAWSDELKRIVGIDPSLFGNNLVEMFQYIVHPDDQARLWEERSRLLRDPKPARTEFRVVRPDGGVRYLWAAVDEAVCDSAGNMIRRSGVVQDITERKLRENEREQLREQLQRQEQLAAVGQLAAGIAHDFNNIMSVISVYAEMIGEAPGLGDKDRARTQTIVDQTQRATRMIRQILDFSRQAVYERRMLDLLPLLKEESRLLEQTLPENIEVQLDYVPGEYFVLADPTRMQQMIVNLALNARDAMPEGGALHVVLGRAVVGPGQRAPVAGMVTGNWVQICVSDTGTGIRPEYLEHIFEPFFTTKIPGRGTGLGLAQVQGIVAQHEGYIATASELGVGTIFTVYLPAAVTQAPAVAPNEAALQVKALAHGQGECVLLVEDDGEVRSTLASLLEEWNYRVVQAANGQEALACLARPWQQVDVILSDVVMPRLGGVGLVKALRKDGVTTPVILMSGYAAGEARMGLQDSGVLAWLDKPLSGTALAGALAAAAVRG
ncbi:MAG: ATP-binding protein [Caldilineaceae bacterium]